ncbi:MAG: hypothetical protein SH848_03115 [Saprospiraceae bacterium]|nr:hypothetical protein [Saprospiraceae bacterium]MDZ4702892.1 hypothetical protein [Saprospiraceae bacterium]
MFKQVLGAALLCSIMAAPSLAQKTAFSIGISIANPHVAHPFENPPQPGSGSGISGGYGGILEKDYAASKYALEGLLQVSLSKRLHLRLRGGYSLRQTDFYSVYGTPDGIPMNGTQTRETARSWHLAPGFTGSHQLGKFSLNAGLEFPVYWLNRLESSNSWIDLMTPEAPAYENERSFPGGMSFGIGPVGGISFHPIPQASIGFELRGAWMYTRLEGNYEERNNWSGTPVTLVGTAETYEHSGMSDLQLALLLRLTL